MTLQGGARLIEVDPQQWDDRRYFWLNEHNPTFLPADPPTKAGEERFEVEFNIDANKRLLVTARDLKTGRLIYKDYPMVRLT